MSDRAYKYSRDKQEHDLKMRAKEMENFVRLLVYAAGESHTIRVSRHDIASLPTFAPLSVYSDTITGDALLCLGEANLSSQWVRVSPPPES